MSDLEISAASQTSSGFPERVRELEEEVESLKRQLDEKVNQSSAMKNMQKILQQKNQLIEELRAKVGS